MKLFAVFQQGVYRHMCGGIFSTEEAATARAKDMARTDRDDYHNYEVVPFDLDQGSDNEADPIFKCNKSK